jgi:adenylate kinase
MIIFMGVAGSGKSAQGRLLADRLGFPWLSTGEFLRMLISGERRKQMLAGKLLDDTEIISLVQKIFRIVDTEHEFVMDGFPRTVAQADWLLSQRRHGQLDITAVIHLKASEEEVLNRLMQRGRQDDQEDVIRERFREYEQATQPIIADLKKEGVPIFDINGEGDVESIHEDIVKAVTSVRALDVHTD